MSGILILTGVELEASTLARELALPRLSSFSFPVFGCETIRVAPVGLKASFLSQRWAPLTDGFEHPLMISAGVCGGLDPSLVSGDLVIPESVLGLSGERLNVTPSHHSAALKAAGGSCVTGCLVTSQTVVEAVAEKAELRAKTGAVAVDMESSIILCAAAASGCPSLVVRGVSDDARQALPSELIALITPEGRLRRVRALALALRHPATIPQTIALQRSARRALGAVSRVLAALTHPGLSSPDPRTPIPERRC